eukprot:12205846-Alexandrium_andersonii.AAC.1
MPAPAEAVALSPGVVRSWSDSGGCPGHRGRGLLSSRPGLSTSAPVLARGPGTSTRPKTAS